VTWTSDSSTGTFFVNDGTPSAPAIDLTDSCILGASDQCSILYSDASTGSPTITGTYSGDVKNPASEGTAQITVRAPVVPTVAVSCTPSEIITSTICLAQVTGSSPTGTVAWVAEVDGVSGSPGTFSPTTCTLVLGSCSVSYSSMPFTQPCGSTTAAPEGCDRPEAIHANYEGDALNEPGLGITIVLSTAAGDKYFAYTDGALGAVPGCSSPSSLYCIKTSAPEGGYGTATVSGTASNAGTVSTDPPLTASGGFSVMGAAAADEVAGTGGASNGGYGLGSVEIADTFTVSGSCHLASNPDPTDLAACLGISSSIEGDAQALCDVSSTESCSYAVAIAVGTFEICDDNELSYVGYSVCASGSVGGEACSGESCPEIAQAAPIFAQNCPSPPPSGGFFACVGSNRVTNTFESPGPVSFGPSVVVSSGDTITVAESLAGGVAASAYGSAGLSVDPRLVIENLDPNNLTVSLSAAAAAVASTPSVLRVESTVPPGAIPLNQTVQESTTVTNTGNTSVTGLEVVASIEGALTCPTHTVAVGAQVTCTGSFAAPAGIGPHTDYVAASGNISGNASVGGSASAGFVVSRAVPVATLALSDSGRIELGGSATATANLTGGFGAITGSLVFDVYSASLCTGSPVFVSRSIGVDGDGRYTSNAFTPASAAAYDWRATFTDTDGNNTNVTGPCGGPGGVLTVLGSPNSSASGLPATELLLALAGAILVLVGFAATLVYRSRRRRGGTP
jgi:hypothetical protein